MDPSNAEEEEHFTARIASPGQGEMRKWRKGGFALAERSIPLQGQDFSGGEEEPFHLAQRSVRKIRNGFLK